MHSHPRNIFASSSHIEKRDDNSSLYVQYGCGLSAGEGWLNFDSSPTLLLEQIPLIGQVLSIHFSGNPNRFPRSVKYGNICKGLPVADGTVRGVYASHVLEHLSRDDLRGALINTNKMLMPGGVFRLIVPDLQERAKHYVDQVSNKSSEAADAFLYSTRLGQERRPRTLMQHLRQLIGNSQHLWMWDEHSMTAELERAKFIAIRRCDFGDSADQMFSRVEDFGRFYDESLNVRECALEARKPE
jgi:hypothetical protein